MKHLFLIHSHTVFLTAMGIIKKLGLKDSDVFIMNFRNYKNPNLGFNYKSYNFTETVEESFHIFLSYSRRNFKSNQKTREKIIGVLDTFINTIINEEYMLYIPHLQSPIFQILATNDKCHECFFVQEGARIMYDYITNKNKWYFILYNKLFLRNENRMWKAYNWFPDKNAPYKKPITAYAFDKAYFGNMPYQTILVTWPKVNIHIELNPQYPIFALEAAVELGQVEKSIYRNAMRKLIAECGKKHNYIKFHPQQTDETKRIFIDMFKEKGLEVEQLPMDIPFELIVSSCKGLTVCGFGSSLLFYAKAFGHTVISHEEELLVSPRYKMYQKKLQKLS